MAENTTEEGLTLDEAAQALGVHYQTAYKWVRAGSLPAVRVAGSYRIERDDLAQFDEERRRPKAPPKRKPRKGFDRQVDRFHEFLVEGDDGGARNAVDVLVRDGISMTEVSEKVIAPTMRRIGEQWYDGDLSIATEHRATAIVERLLGEFLPNPRGRRRGRALVAAVTGDQHSLPTSFAMVALRDDNWHVEHLGADVPPEEIIAFVDAGDIDLVVLTVAATDAGPATAALAAELEEQGTRVLIGSPGAALSDLQAAAREK